MRRRALVAAAALLFLPSAGLAQTPPAELARSFARAWEGRNERAISPLLAAGGVRLRLESEGYGGVEPRRVIAALQSYWSDRSSTEVSVRNVALADREPSRAYGELDWKGVNDVTGEPFEATIFLGFSRGTDGWTVDEIRTILPR